jgi:hypothetical protein
MKFKIHEIDSHGTVLSFQRALVPFAGLVIWDFLQTISGKETQTDLEDSFLLGLAPAILKLSLLCLY